MTRTDKKVGYSPTGNLQDVTPDMAATGVEAAFRMLEGRWKMVIIFHLFDRQVLRFSELERAIPDVSQKIADPTATRSRAGRHRRATGLSAGAAEGGIPPH
jgi:hypothetical protein